MTDIDADELAAIADQMFKTAETKSKPAAKPKNSDAKKKEKGADVIKKPKKPAAEKQYDVYGTVEEALSTTNGRRATSFEQVFNGCVAAVTDSDVIRMEIVALKPAGKLLMLRQLKAPSKPLLNSLKKLGFSELKLNKEKKDDASFVVIKKRAASDGPKKKIVKEKNASRKRLAEGMEKLKKKTAARSAAGQKMAVTASEVVASGSA